MKGVIYENGDVLIELSERNLITLLLKLDRTDSMRTLFIDDEHGRRFYVKAVPNDDHYWDREPGEVHSLEETKMSGKQPKEDQMSNTFLLGGDR